MADTVRRTHGVADALRESRDGVLAIAPRRSTR
jgi:hypothetical protein